MPRPLTSSKTIIAFRQYKYYSGTRTPLSHRRMLHRLAHTVFLTMLVLLAGSCLRQKSSQTSAPVVESPPHVAGIPLTILEKADLRTLWYISRLPMETGAQVKQIFYHNSTFYVLDNRNQLHALDANEGILKWVQSIGAPLLNCSQREFYQDLLVFVVGKSVVEIKQSDGTIVHTLNLKFTPTTTALRLDNTLFLGGDNRRFYALRRSDGIPMWQSVQPADPVGPVASLQNYVYFTCADGTLYASETQQRKLVWQAPTAGKVTGVVLDEDQCFLPSTDTALYCFRAQTGDLMWKYYAGGPLFDLPTLTDRFAYQPVKQASLLCLDRRPARSQGALKWQLKNGSCLLAENGPISYAMTLDNEITLMDNNTGKRLISFYVPDLDLCVRNDQDALIFLASRNGSILALKPTRIYTTPKPPDAAAPAETAPAANNPAKTAP